MYREIAEETGVGAENLELLTPEPRLLVYELPEEYRTPTLGRGQVQYVFVFRFTGPDGAITLGDGEEFSAWRWMPMADLVREVIAFRRPVYEEIGRWLDEILAQ